jgi:hypothetical protein
MIQMNSQARGLAIVGKPACSAVRLYSSLQWPLTARTGLFYRACQVCSRAQGSGAVFPPASLFSLDFTAFTAGGGGWVMTLETHSSMKLRKALSWRGWFLASEAVWRET